MNMRPLATPLYPLPHARTLSRRSFLAGSGAVSSAPKFSAYPFSLGVASGDPLPDGVVLWTRLAPQPLDPAGGMPPESIEVSWQICDDEAMTRVVQSGTATATPDWSHSVHVEVSGLRPARWDWNPTAPNSTAHEPHHVEHPSSTHEKNKHAPSLATTTSAAPRPSR